MKARERQRSWRAAGRSALLMLCACSTEPGPEGARLRVSVLASGEVRRLEGLRITLDNRATVGIGPGEPVQLSVEEGEHTLALSGVPAGCRATDGEVRTVAVASGESLGVAFTIECRSASG